MYTLFLDDEDALILAECLLSQQKAIQVNMFIDLDLTGINERRLKCLDRIAASLTTQQKARLKALQLEDHPDVD